MQKKEIKKILDLKKDIHINIRCSRMAEILSYHLF